MYLSPGCTGRGIGSALLGRLLDGCAAAGARQVIAVIADTGSDASAALHRRFGFTQAGRLSGVGRKHGRWIDTLLMQKELERAGPMSTAFTAGEQQLAGTPGEAAGRGAPGNGGEAAGAGAPGPRPFGSSILAAGRGRRPSGWRGAGMT